MAYSTEQIRAGVTNMNVYAQRASLGDLVFNAASGGYPLDYPGKIYFVNNVTGNDTTGDGLSWSTAYAQVSKAITSVVAFQAAQATASLDTMVRCIIYVAGTTTAYTALTILPNYTDIIGIGALSYGNGTGIAMIGVSGADGITNSGNASSITRGLGLFNLQFISGGSFWSADFGSLFRSEIGFCTFQSATATCDGGIRFSASSGGVYIHDCNWTGANDMSHLTGIYITGTNFDSSRIENNQIRAQTTGIYVASTATITDNTVVKGNVIHGGRPGLTTGIHDLSTDGMMIYAGNFISAATPITVVDNTTARFAGNYAANGFATIA